MTDRQTDRQQYPKLKEGIKTQKGNEIQHSDLFQKGSKYKQKEPIT